MGLFKKDKINFSWDDSNAPKLKGLEFVLGGELKAKSNELYGQEFVVAKIATTKLLISDTDSSKEQIKSELANKLENLYEELCQLIDSDNRIISNEYWYNKKTEENK